MGGSAEYRDGKKTYQKAKNAIDAFLDEHSYQGRGGYYEGYAYEYIAAIAEATRKLDHDAVVSINKTAKAEYDGVREIYERYNEMRKAITQMRDHPRMVKKLLSEYGITVQNASLQNGSMNMTYSFKDKNGNTVTMNGQFDPQISRIPGLY